MTERGTIRLLSTASTAAQIVGQSLATRREAAGLSQRQLATLTGLSRASLQRIEAGETMPSRDAINRLARALGLNDPQRQGLLLASGFSPDGAWADDLINRLRAAAALASSPEPPDQPPSAA